MAGTWSNGYTGFLELGVEGIVKFPHGVWNKTVRELFVDEPYPFTEEFNDFAGDFGVGLNGWFKVGSVDSHELGWTVGNGTGTSRFIVEECHFSEDVTFFENSKKHFVVPYKFGDLDLAILNDIKFVAWFVLEEDDLVVFVNGVKVFFLGLELFWGWVDFGEFDFCLVDIPSVGAVLDITKVGIGCLGEELVVEKVLSDGKEVGRVFFKRVFKMKLGEL